jgi:hypothetical protein
MKVKHRSVYALVILIGMIVGLVLFDLATNIGNSYRNSTNQTATAIISQNHAIKTLIHQIETVTAQVSQGTFTPAPTYVSAS